MPGRDWLPSEPDQTLPEELPRSVNSPADRPGGARRYGIAI